MSNPLAILAVTNTLRKLLADDDAIESVSVRPPDRLINNDAGGRLNLFLYRVAPNAAWRNMTMPDRTGFNEQGFPPLALDLFYLLTAYGDDSERSREHELLARAMLIFHDNAMLSRDTIRQATLGLSGGEYVSDLHEQVEGVRITHDPLSVDELSKLWNTFQTQYRVSTAYRVSLVLIESQKPSRSVLPVLRRGEDDRGVKVFVGLEPGIDRIIYRHNERDDISQMGASIGGRVTLFGNNLPSQGLAVTIRDPRKSSLADPENDIVARLVPERSERPNVVDFRLAANAAEWQGGVYSVEVSFERDGTTRKSNQLPLAIVPTFNTRTDGRPIVSPFREDGRQKLQVEVVNGVHEQRRAYLILTGRRDFAQIPRDKQSDRDAPLAPVFDIDKVRPGQYRLRLRIDGVDSAVTAIQTDPTKSHLEFDPNLIITV